MLIMNSAVNAICNPPVAVFQEVAESGQVYFVCLQLVLFFWSIFLLQDSDPLASHPNKRLSMHTHKERADQQKTHVQYFTI